MDPPPHSPPFKISLITKLSGSIIHYLQQHYTINIQKPLLIGRTIVSKKKKKNLKKREKKEKEKKHTRKQQMYQEPDARLFFLFFFFCCFLTLKCTESFVKFLRRIFSEQNTSPSYICACVCVCVCVRLHVYVYIKTIHDQSVRRVLSQHVSAVAW